MKEDLSSLSMRELLSISLLIEDHANPNGSSIYPEWSALVHIDESKRVISQTYQINPLLLYTVDRDLFNTIPLSSKFRSILSSLID